MVGILAIDWVMYSPNYEMYTYCNLEFTYRTNGKITGNLMTEAFRLKYPIWLYIQFSVFLANFLYLVLVFLRDVYKQYSIIRRLEKTLKTKKEMLSAYFEAKYRKTRKIRCLHAIGIEVNKLEGRNCLIRTVLCIQMVIMCQFKFYNRILKALFELSKKEGMTPMGMIVILIDTTIVYKFIRSLILAVEVEEQLEQQDHLIEKVNETV